MRKEGSTQPTVLRRCSGSLPLPARSILLLIRRQTWLGCLGERSGGQTCPAQEEEPCPQEYPHRCLCNPSFGGRRRLFSSSALLQRDAQRKCEPERPRRFHFKRDFRGRERGPLCGPGQSGRNLFDFAYERAHLICVRCLHFAREDCGGQLLGRSHNPVHPGVQPGL